MWKKKEILFPDCWEEVTPKDWESIMRTLHRVRTDAQHHFEMYDIRLEMARQLLMNHGEKVGGKVQDMITVSNAEKTLDWMWREENGEYVLSFDLTTNLLPKWKHLHGPADHGADLTFGQFRKALVFANAYTQNHSRDVLNMLVACLYWPAKQQYDENLVEKNSRVTFAMPSALQWGVYLWFSSFVNALMNDTFIINGHECEFAPVFGQRSKSESDDKSLGLDSILFSVAEGGTFGTVKQVNDTPLLEIMMKLLDDYNKAEAMKKHLNEKKK